MNHFKYNMENLEEFTPYENFINGVRDKVTLVKYKGQLEMFLNPKYRWDLVQQKRSLLPDEEFAKLVNDFIKLIKKEPDKGKQQIRRYVQYIKKQIESGELNTNTSRNRIKPIKLLLRTNDIEFSWYMLDKTMPKRTKSEDRAYTKEEIRGMLTYCEDIIDKVIIVGFSAGGFRLEAWDYFTWEDVIYFKNDDGSYKGGALRVYRGYDEEYWTHITPEFCDLLDSYRVYWKQKFMNEPKPTDPLLVQERSPYIKRLIHTGVSRRVKKIVERLGLRENMIPGKKRYPVQLDHGFRKYFNTMLRRAKVSFADKEDMMGHKTGLESSYERYVEEDFERFPEYQKAIPFLTIEESQIRLYEMKQEKSNLEKNYIPIERVEELEAKFEREKSNLEKEYIPIEKVQEMIQDEVKKFLLNSLSKH